MTLFASQPVQSFDVSRLWLAVTILVAALPPCFLWAFRRRWQFTLRQLLLAVAFMAAGISWTHEELAVMILGPRDAHSHLVLTVSWRLGDSSPVETTIAVFVLSLVYTFAVQFRAGLQGTPTTLPSDNNNEQSQGPPSSDQPGG